MSIKLSIGISREIITPPIGTKLIGYGYEPGRLAMSVGDDLTVTAIALKQNDKIAMLFSADICLIATDIFENMRNRISDETGVPCENIIISATHTHSGPNLFPENSGWGKPDSSYLNKIFMPRIVSAAKKAVSTMHPALVGVGTTHSNVAVNRRQFTQEGKIILGQNPWGLKDPTMTVLAFVNPKNGEPILNMIHYCAHPTASGNNPEITRDWPGPMVDMLERESGCITTFFNGSVGETGPNLPNGQTTGNYEMAIELGHMAGIDAVRAWKSIKEWRNVSLDLVVDNIYVPYDPIKTKKIALAEYTRYGTEDSLRDQKRYTEIVELIYWKNIIKEHESGDPFKTRYVFQQTIVAIGPVVFVPFQFEMFIEMTLRLRYFSPFNHTLCLSNSNGTMFYLPSQDQICRGGYEVWYFLYGHAYKLVDNADDYMVSNNLSLINRLQA